MIRFKLRVGRRATWWSVVLSHGRGGRNADGSRNAAETLVPHPSEGQYEHSLTGVPPGAVGSGNVPAPSGPDNMYHQYRVTITPYLGTVGMVKISIKAFHDGALPSRNVYVPLDLAYKPNGREQLRLAVREAYAIPLGTGVMVSLPRGEVAHRLKQPQ